MAKKGQIYHKFDIDDKCEICGIMKKTENHVGNGYSSFYTSLLHNHVIYSLDGKIWTKEYTNCIKKLK